MERCRRYLGSVKGSALAEVLVASLVMSFAMFPLLQLALTTIWANNRSQNMSMPLAFAKEKVEELMILSLDDSLVTDDGDVEDLLFYPGHPDQGSRTPDHPLEDEVTNYVEDPVRGGMVEGIEYAGFSGTGQYAFFRVWNVAYDAAAGTTSVNVIVYWYDEAVPHRTQLSTILR